MTDPGGAPRTLGDLALEVRSKNAGPFWMTLEAFMPDEESYRIADALITTELISDLYHIAPASMQIFRIPELRVVKVSFPARSPREACTTATCTPDSTTSRLRAWWSRGRACEDRIAVRHHARGSRVRPARARAGDHDRRPRPVRGARALMLRRTRLHGERRLTAQPDHRHRHGSPS